MSFSFRQIPLFREEDSRMYLLDSRLGRHSARLLAEKEACYIRNQTRNIHPVACPCTDWALQTHTWYKYIYSICTIHIIEIFHTYRAYI